MIRRSLRILVVSPHFAPSAAVGAKRFSYLTAEFERLGHEVEVLALRRHPIGRLDTSVPVAGRVHEISSLWPADVRGTGLLARLYRRVVAAVASIPDQYAGWLPLAIVTGRRVTRRFRPHVIVASGPPFSAFIVAAHLSATESIPLVLDYRDPWTAFEWTPASRAGGVRQSTMPRRLECWAVARATGAVFCSEIMRERFEAMLPAPGPPLRAVITNGFVDEEIVPARGVLTPGAFNIVYAGNFYGQRRLSTLVKAIELRQSGNRDPRFPFAIHVFGRISSDDRHRIASTSLGGIVHEHSPVEHSEILRYLAAGDALFLPSGTDVPYALPFKTFDYLCARRPILAVTPGDSAVARMVRALDCGEVAASDDAEVIASALDRLLLNRAGYSYKDRESYSWNPIATRYAGILHEVTSGGA